MGLLKNVVSSVKGAVKKSVDLAGDLAKTGANTTFFNIAGGKTVFKEDSFANPKIGALSGKLAAGESAIGKAVVETVVVPKLGGPQKKDELITKGENGVITSNVVKSNAPTLINTSNPITNEPKNEPMGILSNLFTTGQSSQTSGLVGSVIKQLISPQVATVTQNKTSVASASVPSQSILPVSQFPATPNIQLVYGDRNPPQQNPLPNYTGSSPWYKKLSTGEWVAIAVGVVAVLATIITFIIGGRKRR